MFARKSIPCGRRVTCGYRVWQTGTCHSPKLGEGRIESYTMVNHELHFLAGPASLINASCLDCANISLELDVLDGEVENNTLFFVRSIKPICENTELVASYGFNYRPDIVCCICGTPLTESGNVDPSSAAVPHIPIFLRPDNFNPLCTADYVTALHNEATALEFFISIINSRNNSD